MKKEAAEAFLQTQRDVLQHYIQQLNEAKEQVSILRAKVKRYELLIKDTESLDVLKHG